MLIRSHILSLCLIAIIGLLLSVLWVQRAVLELSPTQAANFVSAVIKWQWPEHHNNLERAEMRYDWRKMRLQVEIINLHMQAQHVPVAADLPEVLLEFKLASLLQFNFVPLKLILAEPVLTIESYAQEKQAAQLTGKLGMPDLKAIRKYFPRDMQLYKAKVNILDQQKQRQILIDQFWLSPEQNHDKFLTASGSVGFAEQMFPFTLTGNNEASSALLKFNEFPAEILGSMALFYFPSFELFAAVHATHFPISGTIGINTQTADPVVMLLIHSLDAIIYHPTLFTKPLEVTALNLAATLANNFTSTHLDKLQVSFQEGPALTLHGKIALAGVKEDQIQLAAEVTGMNFSQLPHYWPQNLGSNARQWVAEHIPTAEAIKASGTMAITRPMWETGKFTDDCMDFDINLRNAVVDYLPGFPAVTNVDVDSKFSGQDIRIKGQGNIAGSKLAPVDIFIPYMRNPLNDIIITGATTGPASDLLLFVPPPARAKLGISDAKIKKFAGQAETMVHLEIPLEDIEWYDVHYDINAQITKANLELLPGRATMLSSLKGEANFDGKLVTFVGQGNIGDEPLKINLAADAHSPALATEVNIETSLTQNLINAFDAEQIFPFTFTGKGLAQFSLTSNDKLLFAGKVNVKGLGIDDREWGFTKPQSEAGELKFAGELSSKHVILTDLSLTGASTALHGSLSWDKANSQLEAAHFSELRYARSNLRLDYKLHEDKKTLNINAKSLDLAAFDPKPSVAKSLAYSFKINSDILHLKNNTEFNGVSLEGECAIDYCYSFSLNLHSGAEQKRHHAALFSSADDRVFTLRSEDMGYLSLAMGIYKNIVGGELDVRATAPRRVVPAHYTGSVKGSSFTILETVFLSRLFMLTSIVGMGDLLHQGISFSGMRGDIDFQNKILTLKDWQARGMSLGVGLQGAIDFGAQQVKLKGTMVPFLLGINQSIAAIPLLGKLLSGNSMGIIGTDFFLEGGWRDPTMRVNPLSTLAPGFLRGMFGAL